MMKKDILSRREFFKSSFEKVLPILAATALLSNPLFLSAHHMSNACEGSCSGTCAGTCEGLCAKGCTAACAGNCEGTCKESCSGACEGTCKNMCGPPTPCAGTCQETNSGTQSEKIGLI